MSFVLSAEAQEASIPLPEGQPYAVAPCGKSDSYSVIVDSALYLVRPDGYELLCFFPFADEDGQDNEDEETGEAIPYFVEENPDTAVQDQDEYFFDGQADKRETGRRAVLETGTVLTAVVPHGIWSADTSTGQCVPAALDLEYPLVDAAVIEDERIVAADSGHVVILENAGTGSISIRRKISLLSPLRVVSDRAGRVAVLALNEILVSLDGGTDFTTRSYSSISVYGRPLDAAWDSQGLWLLTRSGLWMLVFENDSVRTYVRKSPAELKGITVSSGNAYGYSNTGVYRLGSFSTVCIRGGFSDSIELLVPGGTGDLITVHRGMLKFGVGIRADVDLNAVRPPPVGSVLSAARIRAGENLPGIECKSFRILPPEMRLGARYSYSTPLSSRDYAQLDEGDRIRFEAYLVMEWSLDFRDQTSCEIAKKNISAARSRYMEKTAGLWSQWNALSLEKYSDENEDIFRLLKIDEIRSVIEAMTGSSMKAGEKTVERKAQ